MLAAQGQPAPGGGALQPLAWATPAGLARDGTIAFVAGITGVGGATTDQGLFLADHNGVRALVRSCGGPGGSGTPAPGGDPAPGGGTFAGLFHGTAFAPAVSATGDVLFLADVHGAPWSRGLYLYGRQAGALQLVARRGGTAGAFSELGPGVVGAGIVLFAARAPGRPAELFQWRNGTALPWARIGDALPGGGAIAVLLTEALLLADGSAVPTGPLPAVDDCGRAAYRVLSAGGPATGGIVGRDTDGGEWWYLRHGDATPVGGTFQAFGAPVLGGDGELAVYAEHTSASGPTAGWFVGRPGGYRCALGFGDPVDGGTCLGLALSRGPMTPLDDRGDLVLWCDLARTGGQERIVCCRGDGGIDVLARSGEASPFGGTYGTLNAWPSLRGAAGALLAGQLRGAAAADAHWLATTCPLRASVAVPACVQLGETVAVDVQGPVGGSFALGASTLATLLPLPPLGTLRIGPDPLWLLAAGAPFAAAGNWRAGFPLPPDPALRGAALHFQVLDLMALAGSTGPALSAAASTRLR